ncbi:hypothetical protein AAIR98_001540 [Elusimicrobium simillimum]|uniref:hypothetical protein n=1 Tax=Elusimicrobium simillimum TaxID=3143438 RepID=UPI003C6F0EB0
MNKQDLRFLSIQFAIFLKEPVEDNILKLGNDMESLLKKAFAKHNFIGTVPPDDKDAQPQYKQLLFLQNTGIDDIDSIRLRVASRRINLAIIKNDATVNTKELAEYSEPISEFIISLGNCIGGFNTIEKMGSIVDYMVFTDTPVEYLNQGILKGKFNKPVKELKTSREFDSPRREKYSEIMRVWEASYTPVRSAEKKEKIRNLGIQKELVCPPKTTQLFREENILNFTQESLAFFNTQNIVEDINLYAE